MGLPMVDAAAEQHPKSEQRQMPATSPHEEERVVITKNLIGVRRKIGIHSGKGGVGKTFLSVNIALGLAHANKRVGLLDADIDCPNVARFLNLRDIPLRGTPEGRIHPLEHRGLKIVSTHFLTDAPDLPMIVRGPIKHKVLSELLSQVEWGELDILLYDLPPGTADVPMSSMMISDMDGMIIVTTPQKEAVMDAKKSAIMAKDLGVPVLGIVENMSGETFGIGAGRALSEELGVPFLGTMPLSREIRLMNESAKAIFVEKPEFQQDILNVCLGEDVTVKKRKFWEKLMQR